MLRNPHFWINIAITAFIGYAYYDWYNRFEWFWWFSIREGYRHIVGSLFIIPFVYGTIVFRFRGAVIFWALAFSISLPRIILFSYSQVSHLANNILIALVPLTFVGIITLELNWRKRQEKMQEQREEERQNYMTQIFEAQEKERHRISLELHDSSMQRLLAIANRANDLALLETSGNFEIVNEQASWIRDVTLQVSEELRRISLDLRPGVLDNLGLASGVRWLTERLGQESHISTNVVVKGKERKLPSRNEETIFRMVQEALNNVQRHAEATEVTVSMEFKPKSLRVTIQDNGKGFDQKAILPTLVTEKRLGILSMQYRAKSINATFTIQSRLGEGTIVTIYIVS